MRYGSATLTAIVALASSLPGCDDPADQGTGTLEVRAYGEDFIEDRIPADEVVDGWEIEFSTFIVGITDVSLDTEPLPGTWAVDLTESSEGTGHLLDGYEVDAGPLEHLAYTIESVDVEGTARRGDETKTFAWGFHSPTRYERCELGHTMAAGETLASQITVHADHLFYDDLHSETPNVAFDLIAEADADGDGAVSSDELRAVDITGQTRYQVGSRDIEELWTFIEAQVTTVGHIDGEGHCESSPD